MELITPINRQCWSHVYQTEEDQFLIRLLSLRPTWYRKGPLASPEEIDGPALETLVFHELQATVQNLGLGHDLYYWRTSGGMEVDFVLYGQRGIIAFEMKRKRRLSGRDLGGLRGFLNDYPMTRAFVLYGGDDPSFFDPIPALPIADALCHLPDLL